MNKAILYGLGLLLLCAVVQGLWCYQKCFGDPCVPVYCYTCGKDQCFTQKIQTDVMQGKGMRNTYQTPYATPMQGIKPRNLILAQKDWDNTGCTTAKNRHLCNTTRFDGIIPMFHVNVSIYINMTCCKKDNCNEDKFSSLSSTSLGGM
ncbi:uncharacterized protein LOC143834418 [Paroedura picta]|uniref:uncharacterized protein LOC143834418 n=1 Tax=Paroedura picta TaxID=143630 RepID=UPI004055A289